MSIYQPNIPQANDDQSDSQQDLLNNFQQLDTTFAVDHYTYSNTTANNGKHNQLTMPEIDPSGHPTTASDEVKFYAMLDTANIGLLNYSRGISDAVPTPVTTFQSTAAALPVVAFFPVDILDFTGISNAVAMLYITTTPMVGYQVALVTYTGAGTLTITSLHRVAPVLAVVSGDILQVSSTSGAINVYYTLQFLRITV